MIIIITFIMFALLIAVSTSELNAIYNTDFFVFASRYNILSTFSLSHVTFPLLLKYQFMFLSNDYYTIAVYYYTIAVYYPCNYCYDLL